MRILIVNYDASSGGATIAANRLASALVEAGCEVGFVYLKGMPSVKGVCYHRLPVRIRLRLTFARVTETLWLKFCGGIPSVDRSFNLFRNGAGKWISKLPYDVVHLHWVSRCMLGWSDMSDIAQPLVWTFHDGWALGDGRFYPFEEAYWSPPSSTFPWVSGMSARFAKQRNRFFGERKVSIIAPSAWMKKRSSEMAFINNETIRTVSNAIGSDWGINGSSVRNSKGQRRWAIGASGFDQDPRKGWGLFVEALRILEEECRLPNDVIIDVFGVEGEIELPLPLPYRNCGFLDVESVKQLFHNAEMFVCPSLLDNLPNVVVEALCCACPVICLPVGGLPEMIETGVNGVVAEQADAQSLADALELWSKEYRLGVDGDYIRLKALDDYDPTKIALEHIKIYKAGIV